MPLVPLYKKTRGRKRRLGSVFKTLSDFSKRRTREARRPAKPIRVPDVSRPGRLVVGRAKAFGASRRYVFQGGTKSIYGE